LQFPGKRSRECLAFFSLATRELPLQLKFRTAPPLADEEFAFRFDQCCNHAQHSGSPMAENKNAPKSFRSPARMNFSLGY
jgi:hypothetical protein